ncbi:MAG: hypothetical protein ABL971_16750 [Vicinamibacterales bacterium]
MAQGNILAHGGGGGTMEMLAGLGPVILGAGLIITFCLLLGADRSRRNKSGYRDMTPTSGRLLFSGAYFQLEEMLKHEYVDDRDLVSAKPEPSAS